MKKICIRDCFDTATSFLFREGIVYEFEDGDFIAETDHFIDVGKKRPVEKEEARLDPDLVKKTTKYLMKKYPEAAKKVDLRTKTARRDLIYEIMKEQGTLESTKEEGETMGERLDNERDSKLAASRKR